MLQQRNELDFKGQNIYVGIDVHLKSWTVTILTETQPHKTFSQPPKPEVLADYLKKHFPNGKYHSAYEAGFSGFWAHYRLMSQGINNIVINPADVPTTQKEQYHKNDPVDSRKIAKSLRSGLLTPIHILGNETMEDRSLVRTRSTLVKDMTRFKVRIKSFLFFFGINYPEYFENTRTHWSRNFMQWLKEIKLETWSGRAALDMLIREAENQRQLLLEIDKKIRVLCRSDRYKQNVELLQTVPGIGITNAVVFITQIENVERFSTIDELASYVGLVPTSHSSGEKENKGEMTFRGQKILKSMLVESAWVAVRIDTALSLSYNTYIKRMQPNKAIIRIARKLLNRMYYTLKNKRPYQTGIVGQNL